MECLKLSDLSHYLRYLWHHSKQQCLNSTPHRRLLTLLPLPIQAIAELPIFNMAAAGTGLWKVAQLMAKPQNAHFCLVIVRMIYADDTSAYRSFVHKYSRRRRSV